jgi:hypothetical protein
LIIVLALAFDTLSQQAITVDFRDFIDPAYKTLATFPENEGITARNEVDDFPLEAAIFNGIYHSNIADLLVCYPTGQ